MGDRATTNDAVRQWASKTVPEADAAFIEVGQTWLEADQTTIKLIELRVELRFHADTEQHEITDCLAKLEAQARDDPTLGGRVTGARCPHASKEEQLNGNDEYAAALALDVVP